MRRSEVNRLIVEAKKFMTECGFHLPLFAHWTPEEWTTKGHEYDEIRKRGLGYDLTDFGLGKFDKVGLFLFTFRNGDLDDPASKQYAEKAMVVQDGQVTPWHFHHNKMEDIIARGGKGALEIELAAATDKDELDQHSLVTVSIDGRRTRLPAGNSVVRLEPGQSITLPPRLYHQFKAVGGPVLVGEVSAVNDDMTDNRFLDPKVGRFPKIEQDQSPLYLLCTEYPPAP